MWSETDQFTTNLKAKHLAAVFTLLTL